jgi:NADH oxidase (H2O2-forming)
MRTKNKKKYKYYVLCYWVGNIAGQHQELKMEETNFSKKRVIIIGGGPAGTAAAFEIRKLDKEIKITIIEQSRYTAYSPCALPYVVGREIYAPEKIFVYRKEDYNDNGINLMNKVIAQKIDPKAKTISILEEDRIVELSYDYLIIATGSINNIPPIPGIENARYAVLKTVDDARELMEDRGRKAIIIGAGITGVELAGVLSKTKQVTLIDKSTILGAMLDKDMSERIKQSIEAMGIIVKEDTIIDKIEEEKIFIDNEILRFDTLIITAGMNPNVELAMQAGIKTDKAIIVDEHMQTSELDVYACGGAAESIDGIYGKTINMRESAAIAQAKVAAANIIAANSSHGVEWKRKFENVFMPIILKTRDVVIGATGTTESRAEKHGIKTISAIVTGTSKSEYFPFGKQFTLKLISGSDGKILGFQIFGQEEIAGRINTITMALEKGAMVDDICSLELVYNPSVSPPVDPLIVAAELLRKKIDLLPNNLHNEKGKKKRLLFFRRKNRK